MFIERDPSNKGSKSPHQTPWLELIMQCDSLREPSNGEPETNCIVRMSSLLTAGTLPKDNEVWYSNLVGSTSARYICNARHANIFAAHSLSQPCRLSLERCRTRAYSRALSVDGILIIAAQFGGRMFLKMCVMRRYSMLAWSYIPVAIAGYWAYVSQSLLPLLS